MKKIFIVHGFGGTPNGGWKSWLLAKLAEHDIYACSLPMPKPDKPVVAEWVQAIKNVIDNPNEEIFLIGHSLGVPAILRYLETLPVNTRIGGAFLVSGPLHPLPDQEYESVNNFLVPGFNFPHIRDVCKEFVVLHGDNDPIVPFKEAEDLSYDLGCKLVAIPNGKHLAGYEGWFQFDQLLKEIIKII